MKKSSVLATTLLASACITALANEALNTPASLQPLEPPPTVDSNAEGVDESPQRWFVELSGAPVADGGKRAGVQAEKHAFRKNAAPRG